MTAAPVGLLVSVRDGDEAESALAGGATIIDIKEPRRGSLGAADRATMAAICERIAGRTTVSAALGELLDLPNPSPLVARAQDAASPVASAATNGVPPGIALVKLGLAGCANVPDWPERWRSALARIAPSATHVAVAYADERLAQSPPPAAVLEQAIANGLSWMLIDTFDKQSGGLFTHVSAARLQPLMERARRHRVRVVLAGSLREADLNQVLPLAPDWIAVRGAVCVPHRNGKVQTELVRQLAARLAAASPFSPCGRRVEDEG